MSVTQREFFGVGSLYKLKDIISKQKPRCIFLVTGKKSFERLDKQFSLINLFKGTTVVRFSDFETNPKLEDIKRGIELLKKNNPDLVIAIGGGSVIDTAKAINSLAAHNKEPELYVRGEEKIEKKGVPLIAVPTTSGTGCESTHFAVVNIGKTKFSLADDTILPDYAIVDPELTFDLPAYITACTGLDGLCQAIESYWSNKSTDESKKYARVAIPLLLKSLPDAVNKSTPEARINVCRGAHLAGKAINISQTTASHAISYPITSYFGVPHGHAVALTLASMLEYNAKVSDNDVQDKRGTEYVRQTIKELITFFYVESPPKAAAKISDLMKKIGASTRLHEVGIKTKADISYIITNGFNPGRVKNNPRRLTQEALEKILDNLK